MAWKGFAAAAVSAMLVLSGVYAASLPDTSTAEAVAGVVPERAPVIAPPVEEQTGWVGTWGASPSGSVTSRGYPGYTFRNVVHTSLGGNQVRVRLSNAYSRVPVQLTASVALPASPRSPEAAAGTVRQLTFGGRPIAVVPARGQLLSDPADLVIPADGDLFVTVHTPRPSGPVTFHYAAQQTSFFATASDHSMDVSGLAFRRRTSSWYYVTGVEVQAEGARTIVAVGDSITDGAGSGRDRNMRWPDVLADRLAAQATDDPLAMVNAGINGNRLLTDSTNAGLRALHRLDRDVFAVAGVQTVFVLVGVNDLKQEPRSDNARQILAGLEWIAREARARNVRVVGATILPYRGYHQWDLLGERIRQDVNRELRSGTVFDAVFDFDAAVRDPARPTRLARRYDSGDHLHPNAAGMQAMATSIDLAQL